MPGFWVHMAVEPTPYWRCTLNNVSSLLTNMVNQWNNDNQPVIITRSSSPPWQGIPSTYSRLAKTILGQIHSYPWQVIIFMVVLWSCVPAEESVEGLCMVFLPGRYGINMQRQRFPPPSLFTISTRDGTQSSKVKEYIYIYFTKSALVPTNPSIFKRKEIYLKKY